MILCSFLGSPTPPTAGLMGLCTSCGATVSFLPPCSPSPPWSGPPSLQNNPALAAVGGAGPTHTHPNQWFPSQPEPRWSQNPPAAALTPLHQKLGVVFLFKSEVSSRFLWQLFPLRLPMSPVAMQEGLRGRPPHTPWPLTSPHTLLMAAPPPHYQAPHEMMIDNDRNYSSASVPHLIHVGLVPMPACESRCSGSQPRWP